MIVVFMFFHAVDLFQYFFYMRCGSAWPAAGAKLLKAITKLKTEITRNIIFILCLPLS